VRWRRSFVKTGVDLLLLWWLRRLSIRLYHGIARCLTRWAWRTLSAKATARASDAQGSS
jgi:hypothetical protein